MKRRVAKSFKGHIEQQEKRFENLRKKVENASVIFNRSVARVNAFERKEKEKTLSPSEQFEKQKAIKEMIDKAVKFRNLFGEINRIPNQIGLNNQNFKKTSLTERIRNEVRHRLIRDYSNRGLRVNRSIAQVAASIKISTGADDRTAIERARIIVGDVAGPEINKLENIKDRNDFDERAFKRAMSAIEKKVMPVSDDIFMEGEKSKYMQALNYTTQKRKKEPPKHKEDDYAEGFKWLEK